MIFQDNNTETSSYDEEENYFVSMTDMMIGVLFVFIIMLMVFALDFRKQTDQQELTLKDALEISRQLENLQNQVRVEIGALHEQDKVRSQLLEDISQALEKEGLKVEVDTKNGVLRLTEEAVRFELESAELIGQARTNVGKIASALAFVLPNYAACTITASGRECKSGQTTVETVFVEGHTDKTGSDELNWQLSTQRAVNTYREIDLSQPGLRRLSNREGRQLMSVSGYAATRPIALDNNLAAFAKNRRIDLRFVMESDQRKRLEEILELTDEMQRQIRDLRMKAGG